MTVLLPSLPNAGEDGLAIVNISAAKIQQTVKPVWGSRTGASLSRCGLLRDLMERAQMGRDHIRSYENGLGRAGRLKRLTVGKRKFS